MGLHRNFVPFTKAPKHQQVISRIEGCQKQQDRLIVSISFYGRWPAGPGGQEEVRNLGVRGFSLQ